MNPNAKEFVPAHLLKKRQDEAVGELTNQIGNVKIDESKKGGNLEQNGETSRKSDSGDSTARTSPTTASSKDIAQDQAQEKCFADNNKQRQQNNSPPNQTGEDGSEEQQHNTFNNHHGCSNNNSHHKTNGNSNQDPNQDDMHLLKAGENYCEFNGEQFIIPGEDDDDEYTSSSQDYPHQPGYDFGNAEDNDDEDVCNAYEEFLNDLPQ